MGYYNANSRSKGELLSLVYRLCLYLIVPVAALLPACGYHGSRPADSYPCPDVLAEGPSLLYPIPNASDVPTTPSDLIFASLPLGSDITTSLVPAPAANGATMLQLGAFIVAPSPIPSPAASYAPSTKLYAVAYPALEPNTTYTIQYGTLYSGPCPSFPTSSGSFTTS
jgi:hypothetical protein